MFGKKKVSLNEDIPTMPIIYGLLFGLIIFCIFFQHNIILGLLFIGVAVAIRIFSGKLKLKDGDVVYAFGLPGSGKSMFLTKVAVDNKKRNICVNEELAHLKIPHTVVKKEDLRKYSFGSEKKGGLLLWDEASLDGFDNRNFKTNFSGKDGEALLEAFKKCRHRYTAIVIATEYRPRLIIQYADLQRPERILTSTSL